VTSNINNELKASAPHWCGAINFIMWITFILFFIHGRRIKLFPRLWGLKKEVNKHNFLKQCFSTFCNCFGKWYETIQVQWNTEVYSSFASIYCISILLFTVIKLMLAWVVWGFEKGFAWVAWILIDIARIGVWKLRLV